MGDWIGIEHRKPEHIGFVYVIYCKVNGKKYLGKKMLISNKRRKPLKGRKNGRKYQTESDYKEYYGSCNKLLADVEKYGKEQFTRQIICFCNNKFDLAYTELLYQLNHDVLNRDDFYNEIINVRLRRAKK